MKLFSDILESDKIELTGKKIKLDIEIDDSEVYIIKNNKLDHKVYYPYKEFIDKVFVIFCIIFI